MTDASEGQGSFEWNPDKAKRNFGKHRVTSEEALSAFCDPFALTVDDPDHSEAEDCLIVLSPEMAAVFPDSDSVNEALRTLVKAVQGNLPAQREREAA